jgi:hypothetical protein
VAGDPAEPMNIVMSLFTSPLNASSRPLDDFMPKFDFQKCRPAYNGNFVFRCCYTNARLASVLNGMNMVI